MGYRGKVAEQERARELRAHGWTLGEICQELGVSKASASLWCRDVVVDEKVLAERRRARALAGNEGARRRGPNKLQRANAAEIEAGRRWGRDLIGTLDERDLLIAGAALYAGEGSKTDGAVGFPNSDPRMLVVFLAWLRSTFDIVETRLRVRLYLHAGLDLDAAERHWSAITGIPREQFIVAYRAVPDPSIRTTKHPLGCATVTYSCWRTHRRVMGLVAALLSSDAPGGDVVRSPADNLPG